MTRSTIDIQLATDQVNSLLHACYSETRPIPAKFGIKADAIIANSDPKSIIQSLKRNFYLASVRVAADILKSLLNDPEKTKRNLLCRRD